ncbi:MAG: hypothetical protein P1P89_18295 [Desulfobacterales bacterium]|nr:hypothetical protein [Desulfobacterales bacterium]
MPQHLKQLEHAIEIIWQQGLALTPEAQHYIDSTFSNPTLPELEAILCDESNCEKDSLLELIFFPDQALQVQLEALLESHDFAPEDEEKVSRALRAKGLQTTLLFSDNRGSLALAVPDWVIGRFISRLNIAKKPDPALVDAIRRYVPRPYQALCRVKLRNTRFTFTPNKISFLNVFFKKMTAEFRIVFSAYDFLLAFLDELEDDTDLFRALTQKKRFYFQNLQKAERFSAQLKNSNMETLLLQGVRMPYINTDEARRRIGLIDRICYAVFGKSDFLETGGSIDLGAFDRENGLAAVLKILS